jgi:antitoxin YefM
MGIDMDSVTFDQAVTSLRSLMDAVCSTHEPTTITRTDGEAVVLMSLRDFDGLQETLYLLESPTNAARLRESIAQLKQNGAQARELFRDEEQEGGEQATGENERSVVDR